MRRWATNSPVAAGVALVVAGFIALFLAWNNAANRDFVEGQLPYLISGGMVGLGLIGAGLTVVNIQSRRADQDAMLDRIERLLEARAEEAPAPRPSRTRQLSAAKTRRSA
jgi:hypothetical protein